MFLKIPFANMSYEEAQQYLLINNYDIYLGEPILGKPYNEYDYNDKELDQITNIDYEDIPATMILTEKIKLNGDKLKVSDYYKDNGQTSITVETIDNPDIKPITLIFENNPFQLKQWKIIDQQNIEITISLFNMEKDKKLDEQLFNYKQKISNKKPINRRK